MKLINTILIIILIFSACKNEPEFKGLKLGVIVPLTGEVARNGSFIKDGVEKALSEINKDQELLRVYYEDACLGKEVVNAFNNLNNIRKVNAIAGNYCVIGLNAISEQIDKTNLITFQTSVLPENLASNKNIFSTFSDMKREVEIITNLMKKNSQKKIGVIEVISPWSEEYRKHFKEEFDKKDIEIFSQESYQIGNNDYKNQIIKIKAKKLDALVVIHIGSGVSQIIKELKAHAMEIPVYGMQEAYDPELFSKFNYKGKFTLILPFKPGEINPLSMHAYNNTKLLYSIFTGCKFNESCIKSNLEKKVNNNYTNYVIVDLVNGKMSLT